MYKGGTIAGVVPADVALSAPAILGGPQGKLTIDFETWLAGNYKSLVWYGDNDSGQIVRSGIYYIKFETTDSFGKVTSFVREITVLNPVQQSQLTVFNSAGEAVAHLDLSMFDQQIVDVSIAKSTVSPVLNSGAAGGPLFVPGTGVAMTLTDARGAAYSYEWPALNDLGLPVQSGQYHVRLFTIDPGSTLTASLSRSVQVVHNSSLYGIAAPVAAPNPAVDKLKVFMPVGGPQQLYGVAMLYNLAGEQVASPQGLPAGSTEFDVSRLASGIYVVVVEHWAGNARLARTALKVVVAH
jgi:hypothetical protein